MVARPNLVNPILPRFRPPVDELAGRARAAEHLVQQVRQIPANHRGSKARVAVVAQGREFPELAAMREHFPCGAA